MNKAWAKTWDIVEEIPAEHDGVLTRDGHRFRYALQVGGADIHLWTVEDTPRYCMSVNGVSLRLHASELLLPVAAAIHASGVKPSWEEL